jgi:hypothetical protein
MLPEVSPAMETDPFSVTSLVVLLASWLALLAAPLLAAVAVAALSALGALSYRFGHDSRDGVGSDAYRRGQLWWPTSGPRE